MFGLDLKVYDFCPMAAAEALCMGLQNQKPSSSGSRQIPEG